MAIDPLQRFIPLEGCFNFRDLGGYQTRDGRVLRSRTLFRSDAIHSMTPADAAYVQSSLGVVTVVDLRNADEAQQSGRWPSVNSPVRYYNVPYLEGRDMSPPGPEDDPVERLTNIYQWVIGNSGARIAETLATLSQVSNLPAVFHCTAGKDRAGILAAMVLGVLGVDEDRIMEDYCLTNQIIDALYERLRSRPGNEHRSLQSFEAQPKAMERALAELHTVYGGAEGYARTHGVDDDIIGRLRESLLE